MAATRRTVTWTMNHGQSLQGIDVAGTALGATACLCVRGNAVCGEMLTLWLHLLLRPAASAERGMSRRACCGFSVAACGAFALLVFFVWVSDVPTHGFSAEDVHASVDVDFSKQMCVLRRRASYTRASEALQDDGTPLWMTDPHRAFVTATLFPLPTTVRRMDGKEVGTGPMASSVMGQTLRLVQGEEVIRPVTEVALLSRSLLSFCHRFVPGNHSDVRRRPHASPTVMTIGAVEVKVARPAASSYPQVSRERMRARSRMCVHVLICGCLQFGMDESYTLRINAPVVTIEAAEVWGVMRCGREAGCAAPNVLCLTPCLPVLWKPSPSL